jgi:hypothetical protein
MHTTRLFASWASALSSALSSAKLIEHPTQFDFKSLLQNEDRIFVSFSSQFLDTLMIYNDIFLQSAGNLSAPFVTIDCDIDKSFCADYDINSYPTIRLFEHTQDLQKMQMIRYRRPRTLPALTSFIRRRELPILSHLAVSDMDFRRIDPLVIIAMLDPSDTDSLATYTCVAQEHRFDFAFGYTLDPYIASKEDVQVPSIVAYRNNDGDNLKLGGAFNHLDVENFLMATKDSKIKVYKEKDVETFNQRDKLTVYIFTSVDPVPVRRELTYLAKRFQEHVTFAVVDLARYGSMPRNFGVEMKGEQALVIHAPMNDYIFRYKHGKCIQSDVLENMLMEILQGTAVDVQVFGDEARDTKEEAKSGHDEL